MCVRCREQDDAFRTYSFLLRRSPNDGEALYARAAARLEGLRWREAHKLFRQGYHLVPSPYAWGT
eukprot:1206158-Rhodomonas_salina.2